MFGVLHAERNANDLGVFDVETIDWTLAVCTGCVCESVCVNESMCMCAVPDVCESVCV